MVILLTDPEVDVTVMVCVWAVPPGPAIEKVTGLVLKLSEAWALAVSGLPKRATATNAKTSVKRLILRKVFSNKDLGPTST